MNVKIISFILTTALMCQACGNSNSQNNPSIDDIIVSEMEKNNDEQPIIYGLHFGMDSLEVVSLLDSISKIYIPCNDTWADSISCITNYNNIRNYSFNQHAGVFGTEIVYRVNTIILKNKNDQDTLLTMPNILLDAIVYNGKLRWVELYIPEPEELLEKDKLRSLLHYNISKHYGTPKSYSPNIRWIDGVLDISLFSAYVSMQDYSDRNLPTQIISENAQLIRYENTKLELQIKAQRKELKEAEENKVESNNRIIKDISPNRF